MKRSLDLNEGFKITPEITSSTGHEWFEAGKMKTKKKLMIFFDKKQTTAHICFNRLLERSTYRGSSANIWSFLRIPTGKFSLTFDLRKSRKHYSSLLSLS